MPQKLSVRSIAHCLRGVFASTDPQINHLLPYGGLPRGRLVEVSGRSSSGKRSIALSFCVPLLLKRQAVFWIDESGAFYPTKCLEQEAILGELIVVRVHQQHRPQHSALSAADMILQSSAAISLLVLDVPGLESLRTGQIMRLQKGARRSNATVLLLTERWDQPSSLGSAIALHMLASRSACVSSDIHLTGSVNLQLTKNKLGHEAGQRSILFAL